MGGGMIMPQQKLADLHQTRPQWRSRTGFILAALGSAIGLGNIWRFSYLCYKNGGGAFLIPYLIALVIVGIPLMILELSIGHKMRGSSPLSFARVHRSWEWVGWWAVTCAMYGIMIYYSAVIAWCVNYVIFSLNLRWGADPNNFFFNEFLKVGTGPFDLGEIRTPILLSLLFVWVITWIVVFFGVQKGVERSNKIFMPILFVLIAVLVFWGMTLQGAKEGIRVYLKPDFSHLTRPQVWIDAFSQIFFTLSLAFGIMIAYASYLPRKADLVMDALVISIGNCLFSIFAGFAVFGTLGYMSFTMGKPVNEVVSQSIGLAFVTYPQAISLIPGPARLFGVIFFISLVIAGITSAVSLIEAFSSAIIDKFAFSRKSVVSVVCAAGFALSVLFATRSGLFWVDIVDHFITHYGLVTIGVLECVLIAWIFNAKKLRMHINKVSHWKINGIWDICVRFIVPSALMILLWHDLQAEFAKPYEGYSWIAILLIGRDWLIATLIVAMILTMYPWRKEIEEWEKIQEFHQE